MSCEPVRLQALEILLEVAAGQSLDPLLDKALHEAPDARAAGFLAELVRGTLQWQGRYDHVVAEFSRKRPPSDPVLVGILRLSLHQLLGMGGVPPYAAIHQAGELCRKQAGRGKVGFINGMLQAVRRRLLGDTFDVAGREKALRQLFRTIESDQPRWLAAWYSLPPWLVARWVKNFGADGAAALCAWTNEPPGLHLHVLGDHPAMVADLRTCDVEAVPGPIPGALTVTNKPSRQLLRACLDKWPSLIVQDLSVQAATQWLTSGLSPQGRILDMCAAPGGKTVHLRELLPGADLVAMDYRQLRMRLLRDTLDRVAPDCIVCVQGSGESPPFAPDSFDGILLDGPCSGTGVLRHHPDGRWRLQPRTPQHRALTLLALGRQAVGLLRSGGRLMYATCSLEPEENDQVLTGLFAEFPALEPDPDSAGVWRRYWLPHEGSSAGTVAGDGFFAARLRKRP